MPAPSSHEGLGRPWFEAPAIRTALTGALPAFLRRQRWFPAKDRAVAQLEIEEAIPLDADGDLVLLAVGVEFADGVRDLYALPAALAVDAEAERIAREAAALVIAAIPGRAPALVHSDVAGDAAVVLLDGIVHARRWPTRRGAFHGTPTTACAAYRDAISLRVGREVTGEQSNSSVVVGERLIVKLFRRLEPGLNPEYEISRHLTERERFEGVPALAGAVLWREHGRDSIVVALAQAFVPRAPMLRERIVNRLVAIMRDGIATTADGPAAATARHACQPLFAEAEALGRRTAELHTALARAHGDPAFEPEPISAPDLEAGASAMLAHLDLALDLLTRRRGEMSGTERDLADRVLAGQRRLASVVERAAGVSPGFTRIRVHGDYQLDQVLVGERGFVIIDFEGEPLRPIAERRRKTLALKDVAGMVRSYSYAAWIALREVSGGDREVAGRLQPLARWWQDAAAAAFVGGYRNAARREAFVPASHADFRVLLDAFTVDKAAYELRYEMGHRPEWLAIPLRGLLQLLDRTPAAGAG